MKTKMKHTFILLYLYWWLYNKWSKSRNKKIKQILSNAQQQWFIYHFENNDTESIGSLEKVDKIQNSNEIKSIKVLIQKVYELK